MTRLLSVVGSGATRSHDTDVWKKWRAECHAL